MSMTLLTIFLTSRISFNPVWFGIQFHYSDGCRRRHEAVCRNGLDAPVWLYILVSLLATMAAAGAQHTNAHQLMTSRGDGGLKSLAAGLEVVSIMAAAAAQE